jgi:hypothetical protein
VVGVSVVIAGGIDAAAPFASGLLAQPANSVATRAMINTAIDRGVTTLVDRSHHDRSPLHGGADQQHRQGFETRQQQAATQDLQTIQQAFREVEDALVFHRKVREIRTEHERRVAATSRALSLATLRYDRGLSTQLEVLDAQRELAELDLASTTRDQLAAVVQLYKALGSGWQSQPPAGHSSFP